VHCGVANQRKESLFSFVGKTRRKAEKTERKEAENRLFQRAKSEWEENGGRKHVDSNAI